MKKFILIAPLIALILYAAYAVLTLDRFTTAVGRADADALTDLVDFPAVRASLKQQITSALMTRAFENFNSKDSGSVLGMGLLSAFGPTVINNMVDSVVTPTGAARFIQNKFDANARRQPDFSRIFGEISIVSPTSFKLVSNGGSLVFRFEDWTWKLTEMRIPPDALDGLPSGEDAQATNLPNQQNTEAYGSPAASLPTQSPPVVQPSVQTQAGSSANSESTNSGNRNALASVNYDGNNPAQLKYGDLVIRIDRKATSDPSIWLPIVNATSERGEKLFSIGLVGDEAMGQEKPAAQVEVMKLDPRSQIPQVVFTYYTGGAHCCTVTQIAAADPNGSWHVLDGGSQDGDGYDFRDINHDGGKELIASDNSFLYAFGCYACSYTPTRIKQLVGLELKDVTKDAAYRPFLQQQLENMEASARKYGDDQTFSSPGYLAGWVAAKTLIGQLPEAWSTMLKTYREDPNWPLEECSKPVPLYQCAAADKHRLDFPHALADHLIAQGYITSSEKEQLALNPGPAADQASQNAGAQPGAPINIGQTQSASAGSPSSGLPIQPSFDCALGLTAIEQTICSDSELSQWDSRMGQAFKWKFAQMVPGDRRLLLKSQRQWIALRKRQCDVADRNSSKQCILELTKARLALIEGSTESIGAPPNEFADAKSSGGDHAGDKSYLQTIFPLIMAQRHMPTTAHPAATAIVAFWLDNLGNVSREKLYKTSGYRELDADSLAAVMRAGPFPALSPGQLHGFIARMFYPSTMAPPSVPVGTSSPYASPPPYYGASQN